VPKLLQSGINDYSQKNKDAPETQGEAPAEPRM
jgi:hypothetical protein